MGESHDDVIEAPPELRGAPARASIASASRCSVRRTSRPRFRRCPRRRAPAHERRADAAAAAAPEPSAEEIREALRAQHGRVTHAARALGLSSRYALYRLMKKHGIDSDPPPPGRSDFEY